MPTTTITNLDATRLKDILSKGATYESRFLYLAISTLLEELVGAGTTDDLIDSLLPATPTQLAAFGGYGIEFFAGLSRTRIKQIKRRDNGVLFSDADVDAIYTALGVVEGGGLFPREAGAESSEDSQESSEDVEEKEEESQPNEDEE